MSEQVEGAVNPGQAIYDALSAEAKAAVDALPDDLFRGDDGVAAASRMVDAIEIANAQNAFGWSLQFRNTNPPNLGLQIFAWWRMARIPGALLLGTVSDSDLLPMVQAQSDGTPPALEEFLAKRTPIIVLDGVKLDSKLENELFEASRQALEVSSGTGWRRDISANSHRDDWRVKLALLTGRDVPSPGYVSVRHLGISQETIEAPSWLRNRLTIDALPLLVETIETANDVHPGSWALTGGKSRSTVVGLNVQGTSVLEFQNRWTRLVVPREWWDQHQSGVDGEYLHDIKSPAGAVRINIDPGPEPVNFHQYSEPLFEVVRNLASMTRTQTQRAAEHRPELVRELAEFLNEDVPQPSYAATNRAQAIYDALSDEARAAVDALPDSVFNDEASYRRAQRFAQSILKSNELGPQSWSLQSHNPGESEHYLALNVGQANMLRVGRRNEFTVSTQVVRDSGLSEDVADCLLPRSETTDKRLYLDWDLIDSQNLAQELVEAHETELAVEARPSWTTKSRKNQWWKWHRDDWRVKLAMLTGVDLPAPDYVPEDRVGLPMHAPSEASESATETIRDHEMVPSRESLRSRFAAAGLTYTNEQIASFYTALQTKGFVILSGISGTGKSKIALRFAAMMPAPNYDQDDELLVRSRAFERDVVSYMHESDGFILPRQDLKGLTVPEVGERSPVQVQIGPERGEGMLVTGARSDGSRVTSLEIPDELISSYRALISGRSHFAVGLYGSVDIEKAVVELAEDATELPEMVAFVGRNRPLSSPPTNHLFLPVRPDWRDGKALIGYHNPLSSEYVRTDFLEFVLAAADDFRAGNRNAFFVILDEMNLAHVEYYFADVLSVIESGRDEAGWTVEGIPLAVGDEDADLPETLKLPPNLYIVGTVNMDETTHPFSPKVLDRAFTIELTEVDFNDYPKESTGSAEADEAAKRALLDAFTRQGRYPRIDKREIAELVDRFPRFRADLQSLNTSLRRSRMHFGYRVFDEIMQFVYNAELNGMFTTDEAFDHAVLMKVLPKFNGSRGKLQTALFELLHWCRTSGTLEPGARADLEARFSQLIDKGQPFDSVVTDGADTVEDNWRYPATGRRAALMMQDLYTDGFASFG